MDINMLLLFIIFEFSNSFESFFFSALQKNNPNEPASAIAD